MNNLLKKQANKTIRQNTLSFALFTATLLSSSAAFANRPAMEESNAVSNEVSSEVNIEVSNEAIGDVVEAASEMRPEALPEVELTEPASVEVMMPPQDQQTYQTGDVVQLPVQEIQPGETLKIQLLDYPRRGMNMDKVKASYGQPNAISETIGKPPITHWTYNDRVVYFEYSTVIHVVAR